MTWTPIWHSLSGVFQAKMALFFDINALIQIICLRRDTPAQGEAILFKRRDNTMRYGSNCWKRQKRRPLYEGR